MRHIAVVGSGPAGYYTAEAAQKEFGDDVRDIELDAQGNVWVATQGAGIYRSTNRGDMWQRFSSGLPVDRYGPPTADRYGGPILCQWMIDLGYQDLR